MNVLHISHMYPVSYDPMLGITIHKQVLWQQNNGHKCRVIAPSAWAPFPLKYLTSRWKAYSELPRQNVVDGIEVFHPRYLVIPRALLFASAGARLHRVIKKLVDKLHEEFPFDLVHTHMALPDGYAGMLIGRKYDVPLVVTIQATDLDFTAKRNARCWKTLEAVFTNASEVISPSPRLARVLQREFAIAPTTIGYAVTPSDIHPGITGLRSQYEGRRLLLSVSRLIPTKGIDLNLYALAQLLPQYPDLLYLIVGDGPCRQDWEQLADDLGLKNHVEFLGQMPYQLVMEYMANCDVFSMPSWQETFGLVYIEAMAHEKPVIGVQGQGIDGIIEHGKTGLLVKPKDVDDLVGVLDSLLSNLEDARAMGQRARQLVLEKYTWESTLIQVMQVYSKALESR